MQHGMARRWLAVAALAALAAVAPSAAAQGPAAPAPAAPAEPATDDAEALRQRVAQFYAARLAGDARGQWELLEPRVRARTTPEEFAAEGAQTRYLGYKVENAAIRGAFGKVQVRVLTLVALPTMARGVRQMPPQVSMALEQWMKLGGVWYRMTEEVEAPAPRAQSTN